MKRAFSLLMLVVALPAWAQTAPYPTRPVRLINPYPPGASADFVARTIAAKLSERLGQPILVENKPGGGTLIGTDFVAKAPADGYTILFTDPSAISVVPHVQANLFYDPFKDFVHVTQVCEIPFILTLNPSVKAESLRDLLALVRANPGKITFASTGQGTGSHLAGEMFKVAAGIDLTHVPYKGGGPALNDLLAGRVDMMINAPTSVIPHIKAGKLRAIGVSSARRLPALPDVPTVNEAGMEGFVYTGAYGMSVPRATPAAVVARLNSETRAVVSSPDVAEKFVAQGLEPHAGSSEEFTSMLRDKWTMNGNIIRRIGLKAE